jgi:hypothetical protein
MTRMMEKITHVKSVNVLSVECGCERIILKWILRGEDVCAGWSFLRII